MVHACYDLNPLSRCMFSHHISSVISKFFFFQNNPKTLEPSYKMALDFWDCLEGKTNLIPESQKTDLDIRGHARDGKYLCLITKEIW